MINRSGRFVDIAGLRLAVWIDLIALGTLTAFLTWYCVTFTLGPQHFAYLWLPNGLVVGTLLSVPQRLWPRYLGVALLGIAAGRFQIIDSAAQLQLQAAILAINMAEIAAVAMVLAPQVRETDRNNDLALIALVIAVTAVPTATSVAASLALHVILPASDFNAAAWAWFFAHTLGLVLAAPLVMVARKLDVTTITRTRAMRLLAGLALVTLSLGATIRSGSVFVSFLVPASVVAAAVFSGILGAVLSNTLAAIVLIGATQYDLGPFDQIGDIITETNFLQLFLIGCIVASFGLALHLAFQRRRMLGWKLSAQDSEGRLLTDPSTDLPNKLALAVALADIESRPDCQDQPISFAVFDMIGYDALRHTKGRDAAQNLVRAAAESMKGVSRTIDYLAHVSDHELVVVMPLTDRPHAMDIATGYHNAAAAAIKTLYGVEFRISVFVDTIVVRPGVDLDRLISGAHRMPPQAKAGRIGQ